MSKKKKNSSIIGTIFILTFAFICLMYKFIFKYIIFLPAKWIISLIKNNTEKKEIENNVKEETIEPVMSVYFKVAGVTFENRQKTIKKLVNENKNSLFHKPYFGMTNKEILEDGNEIYEINDLKVNSIRLEPTEENTIEIYITDNEKNEYLMGYVPEHKIVDVQNFFKMIEERPELRLSADSYFTGGKYKVAEFSDDGKEIIKTYEHNYGINVKLELYDK